MLVQPLQHAGRLHVLMVRQRQPVVGRRLLDVRFHPSAQPGIFAAPLRQPRSQIAPHLRQVAAAVDPAQFLAGSRRSPGAAGDPAHCAGSACSRVARPLPLEPRGWLASGRDVHRRQRTRRRADRAASGPAESLASATCSTVRQFHRQDLPLPRAVARDRNQRRPDRSSDRGSQKIIIAPQDRFERAGFAINLPPGHGVRPLHGVGDFEHHQHAMAASADQLLQIDPDSIVRGDRPGLRATGRRLLKPSSLTVSHGTPTPASLRGIARQPERKRHLPLLTIFFCPSISHFYRGSLGSLSLPRWRGPVNSPLRRTLRRRTRRIRRGEQP